VGGPGQHQAVAYGSADLARARQHALLLADPHSVAVDGGSRLGPVAQSEDRGRAFFRASYFMPVVVSGVVVTILWHRCTQVETGLINLLLQVFGLPKIGWLTDRR